jgi:CxxC-x17-CxxC domain-containing protein
MTIKDKTIICKDCGKSFMFRADEQSFFEEKGYSEPTRCKDCRAARKNSGAQNDRAPRGGTSGGRFSDREMFPATCASCGRQTQVPFRPREGRPVYCKECFTK